MKLALQMGYWERQPPDRFIELAQRAEALGFDSVITAEAYGSDCFTPLAAIAATTKSIRLGTAVMQLSARTPTCAAMTALTLDHISGGRLWLGVGVSGPQVVEGWYGQPFPRPLERTREWLDIFRKVLARENPLTHEGRQYQIPYAGSGSTGLGKPLRSITHPLRSSIPVLLGAEGPNNVALAFEEFDGWLPMMVPPTRMDRFTERFADKRPDFEIIANVAMNVSGNHAEALRPIKETIALYVGGMGAKDRNFHSEHVTRLGYGEEARVLQELWLSGRQEEAIASVPDSMADDFALVGPESHVRERLRLYKASGVTTLAIARAKTFDQTVRHMEIAAEEVL